MMYDEILEVATSANLIGNCGVEFEAMVDIKYKIEAKKVKPMATQLQPNTNNHMKHARK